MNSHIGLAVWSFAAGAGIPLIGLLNSGMSRALGSAFAATCVLFAVAFSAAAIATITVHGLPAVGKLLEAPLSSYFAGLLIGFYALSATIIIPRFGANNFVVFILIAQLVTSAAIDHFGILGVPERRVEWQQVLGFLLIVAGIVILQIFRPKAA